MADKNIEIQLKGVRASFLNVFESQEFKDEETGKVRYSRNVNLLIPKRLADGTKNPVVAQLSDAMKQALESHWPGQEKKIPSDRRCVRDGEPIDPDTIDADVPGSGTRFPLYDGYAGHYFVSANKGCEGPNSPNLVQLLGPKKTAKKEDGTPCFPTIKKEDGLLYSGCWVDAIIRIYPLDGKGKFPDRINASLEALKFKRHGDAFGAKPVDAQNVFDEEGDDEGTNQTAQRPADDDGIG